VGLSGPLILETEPDQEFLGFMLETKPLELIYCGPTNISQVLSPFSASPPKVLLSGFRSRCHIVVKGAFPEHRVQQGLDQLTHLYTLACFSSEELNGISSQIVELHCSEKKESLYSFPVFCLQFVYSFMAVTLVLCCVSGFSVFSSWLKPSLPSSSCSFCVRWSLLVRPIVEKFTTTWPEQSCT
jgi:hypothetical protein